MRWYVMQTKTGGEEKLAALVRKMVPNGLYGECFVIYFEQLWRRHQKFLVHVERAFPGYVFITADNPENLYISLKTVPAMSKIIADDNWFFLPVEEAEQSFLRQIMDEKHIIRMSYLATDGRGGVRQASGPLQRCLQQVVRYDYKKRTAAVRLRLAGAEKQVLLGIVLHEDIRRQLCYGKVETPGAAPEYYRFTGLSAGAEGRRDVVCGEIIPASRLSAAGRRMQAPAAPLPALGSQVMVSEGELSGMLGTVLDARKHTVRLQFHFLGRNMEMEVPLEMVREIESIVV